MIDNKYQDCVLACFVCGEKSDLMQVAHRDMNNFVVGYLFLCREGLESIGGKYSVELHKIRTSGKPTKKYKRPTSIHICHSGF